MENLQKLYDETASKFEPVKELKLKQDKVAATIETTKKALVEAEVNYNASEIAKLTATLSSSKQVLERITSDLVQLKDKIMAEINGPPHNIDLTSKISAAARKSFRAENNSSEVQGKLKEISELNHQARVLQEELEQSAAAKHRARVVLSAKFQQFLPQRPGLSHVPLVFPAKYQLKIKPKGDK